MSKKIWEKFDKKVDLKGLKNDIENADTSAGDYPEIPKGQYEVEVVSMELKETKENPRPMLSVSFKILSGEHKGLRLFENKVLMGTKNDGQMIKSAIGFLESFDTDVNIDFENYSQFNDTILDVFEAIEDKLEFLVQYDPKKFFSVSIEEVFEK